MIPTTICQAIVILVIFISHLPLPNHSLPISEPKQDSNEGDNQPTLVIISSETDENSGNPNAGLGPSWGAVAVADHNSRPWEDPEQDFSQDSLANTPVSDLFEDQSSITNNNNKPNQSSNNGPNRPNHPLPLDPSIPVIGAAEMHEFPHQNHPYQYPAEQNVVSQTSSVSSTSSPASTRYPFINP